MNFMPSTSKTLCPIISCIHRRYVYTKPIAGMIIRIRRYFDEHGSSGSELS